MKTTNWQTKALTLFIAAVALWLTTACGNVDPTIETQLAPATTETSNQTSTEAPHRRSDQNLHQGGNGGPHRGAN